MVSERWGVGERRLSRNINEFIGEAPRMPHGFLIVNNALRSRAFPRVLADVYGIAGCSIMGKGGVVGRFLLNK